jgi:hypothetical protein
LSWGLFHYSKTTEKRRCNVLGSVSPAILVSNRAKQLDVESESCSYFSVLQGKAADILHTVLPEQTYKDMAGALRKKFR